MSRLSLVAVAVAVASTIALPAAAQARVKMTISRVETRTERAHPAVATLRVVVTVCVRNVSTAQRSLTPTVRSNFLLSPRKGQGDNARWGYTIPVQVNAAHSREHCQVRNVAGVAEDVERRLRISAEPGDGIGWVGPRKVGPGHRG